MKLELTTLLNRAKMLAQEFDPDVVSESERRLMYIYGCKLIITLWCEDVFMRNEDMVKAPGPIVKAKYYADLWEIGVWGIAAVGLLFVLVFVLTHELSPGPDQWRMGFDAGWDGATHYWAQFCLNGNAC
jgi:hypothetical protein